MTGKPCKVAGCPNEAHSRGWCHAHLLRVYKHGDPQEDIPLQPRGETDRLTCRIRGCPNPIHVKYLELCNAHYLRMRRTGDPETPDRRRNT